MKRVSQKIQGRYGCAQWTGSRREKFFEWADKKGLKRDCEAASLGFLEHELKTTHHYVITRLKPEVELSSATKSFMLHFEGPGICNESSRQSHAIAALNA